MPAVLKKEDVLKVPMPKAITSEAQFDRYVEALDMLDRKEHATVAEETYAEILSLFIKKYEDEHYSIPDVKPLEALKYLMEANGLKQKDLRDVFGSEAVASRVLSGKRSLEHYVGKLAQRFSVSTDLFFRQQGGAKWSFSKSVSRPKKQKS